jgi:hypothetical protein
VAFDGQRFSNYVAQLPLNGSNTVLDDAATGHESLAGMAIDSDSNDYFVVFSGIGKCKYV